MGSKNKKNPGAVAMAKRRAEKLTAERRKEIACQAAKARWDNHNKAQALSPHKGNKPPKLET